MLNRIAIVAAMEREISFLRSMMIPPDHSRDRLVVGSIGSKSVTLLRTGVGPQKTTSRLAEITDAQKPECVISIGCAGGLSPNIGIGEVVLPEKLIDDSMCESAYSSSPQLVKAARACCDKLGISAHSGCTVSTAFVAATPEDKQRLWSKYGAVAVDMESAQVGAWAAASGLPMVAIRVISDTVSDRIPPEAGTIIGPDEKISIHRAILLSLRRPRLFAELLRLKRNLDHSFANIEKVVTALLHDI